jgi:hypothetical protein
VIFSFIRRWFKPQACGGCVHDTQVLASLSATNTKARTFKYQIVDRDSPATAFRGMSNPQTVLIVREAMTALSLVCGAKFVEVDSYANLRIYFKDRVDYDAIGVYAGNGNIWMSRTRSISAPNAKTCVMHEVGHFLNLWANPRSDGWGHCPDKTCIYHINGTGRDWCPACRTILVSKFGPLAVRSSGTTLPDAPSVGGPQTAQPLHDG